MSNGDPSLPVLPPPGWYADPMDASQERWWSGEGWSEHERALPTTVVMDAEVPQYASVTAPEPEYPASANATGFSAAYPSQRAVGEYQPMSGYQGGGPAVGSQWRSEVGSPNTVGVWIVAVYPLAYALAVLASAIYAPSFQSVQLPITLVGIVTILVAGMFDHVALTARGLSAPSVAWLLLTGIGYQIARRFALKRDGVRHDSPLWVLLACGVLSGVILTGGVSQALGVSPLSLSLPGAVTDRDAIRTLESTLETSLEETTTSTWLVSCPETQDISVDGTRFACNGTNAAGERALISIEVAVPQNFIVTRMDRVK